MSLPARKYEPEIVVEERIARLEATVDHMQSDVTEIKSDIRRLDSKIDSRFDSLKDSLIALERHVRDGFESLRVARFEDRLWALLTLATLLGVMARVFEWI
jgi:hypothetical protein